MTPTGCWPMPPSTPVPPWRCTTRRCWSSRRGSPRRAAVGAGPSSCPARPPTPRTRSGQFAVEAEALHDAVRFGDRKLSHRLQSLAVCIDGPLPQLYARHAAALADSDGDALDAVSIDFEQAGLLLSAADAAAQAAGFHEQRNARRAEIESVTRAMRLASLCGGALLPCHPGCRATTAGDRARTRGRRAGCRRRVESGDRRAAVGFGSHHRGSRVPGMPETRCVRSRWAGRHHPRGRSASYRTVTPARVSLPR